MCTAVCFKSRYFGRNFDLDCSYGEETIIAPRKFPFMFREIADINHHFAIIGTGTVRKNYPLFYDAANEKGLGVAGLNFPKSAKYFTHVSAKKNISPFELIPYVLSTCDSVNSAEKLLKEINLCAIPFSENLPLSPLHWIFSDKERSIVYETTAEGSFIYRNYTNVLTNEPVFPFQLYNLNNYMHLSPQTPGNSFSHRLPLSATSYGMGTLGMPGDLSSQSRFVRAVFTAENSVCEEDVFSGVTQFFHILDSVSQKRGCVVTEDNNLEYTRYSCCVDLNNAVYYSKTYQNSTVNVIDMFRENLEVDRLYCYPMQYSPAFTFRN